MGFQHPSPKPRRAASRGALRRMALAVACAGCLIAPLGARPTEHGSQVARTCFDPFPLPASHHLKEAGIGNEGSVPSDVATGDFDGDGLPDAAVAYAFGDEVRWFRGQAGGQFVAAQTLPINLYNGLANDLPRQLIAGDFNDDALPDLLVIASGLPPSSGYPPGLLTRPHCGLLAGKPGGGFEPYRAFASFPSDSTFALHGDLARQGERTVLAIGCAESHQMVIFEHTTDSGWTCESASAITTSGEGPYDVRLADVDRDGRLDAVVINEKDIQVRGRVLEPMGPAATLASGQEFTAGVLADFDDDGAWDLAALDGGAGQLRVWFGIGTGGTCQQQVSLPVAAGAVDLKALDLDLDGDTDLALVGLTAGQGQLLRNRGGRAGFEVAQTFPTASQPRAIESVQWPGRDVPDLLVANEGDVSNSANEDVTAVTNTLPAATGDELVVGAPLNPGAALPPSLDQPWGLGWDATRGALWCIERRARELVALLPQAAASAGASPSATVLLRVPLASIGGAALLDPVDVAPDAQGRLWLADRLAGKLVLVDPQARTRLAEIDTAALAGITRPGGVALDDQGRLYTGDAYLPRAARFSAASQALMQLWTDAPPLRDLTWLPSEGRLLAVGADKPQWLLGLRPDGAGLTYMGMQEGEDFDPLCDRLSWRAVAWSPTGDGTQWMLTTGGALLEVRGGALQSVRELRLLRGIRAVLRHGDGSLWLGDGGLLATLAHVTTGGQVLERVELNKAGQNMPPVEIRGLARGAACWLVLDGRMDMLVPFSFTGQRRSTNGPPLPPDAYGLIWDVAQGVAQVGTQGRLREYAVTLYGSGDSGIGYSYLSGNDRPLNATRTPVAVGRGGVPGELAFFSLAGGPGDAPPMGGGSESGGAPTLPIVREQNNALQRQVVRTRGLPTDFATLSATLVSVVAAGDGITQRGYMAGSGASNLMPFSIERASSACLPQWLEVE